MFEYKAVPAPMRAPRVKGLKTTADRYAHSLAESLNAEASGGWQFLRMETVTVEERSRLGRTTNTSQTVMIFQRKLSSAAELDAGYASADAAYATQSDYDQTYEADFEEPASNEPVYEVEPDYQTPPAHTSAPSQQRQEPLFRSGALRAEPGFQRSEPVLRPRGTTQDDGV